MSRPDTRPATRTHYLLWLLTFMFLTIPLLDDASAQDCVDYQSYFRYLGGSDHYGVAERVVLDDDHAYVLRRNSIYYGYGGGISVVDIDDLTTIGNLGEWYAGTTVHNLLPMGDLAYAGIDQLDLAIFDITDPANLDTLSTVDLPGVPRAFVRQGDLVYTAISQAGLQVLDVTDPHDPQLVGAADTYGTAMDLALGWGYAYLAAGDFVGLQVVDIADPENPVHITDPAVAGDIVAVTIEGDHLFTVGTDGLQIHTHAGGGDLTTIAQFHPEGVDTLYAVSVDGDRVLTVSEDHLFVVDISDPTQPTEVERYRSLDNTTWIVQRDQRAYITRGSDYSSAGISQMGIFDISQDGTVPLYEHLLPDGRGRHLAQGSDGKLYLAADYSGIIKMDIGTPGATVVEGSIDPGSSCWYLAPGDGYMLAACAHTVWTIDLATFTATGSAAAGGFVRKVVLRDEIAYVASGDAGVTIFDYTDPNAPVQIGSIPLSTYGDLQDVELYGDTLYAWESIYAQPDELWVVDVSDPAAPVVLSVIVDYDYLGSMITVGDLLYICSSDEGDALEIFDLTDPTAPQHLNSFPVPGDPYQMTLDGNLLYVPCLGAAWDLALVLDVTDPVAPQMVGHLDTGGKALHALPLGERLFLAEYDVFGVEVGPVHCSATDVTPTPSATSPLIAYPNPFNPQTNLRFTMSERGKASVILYDIGGRRIRTLVDGVLTAGDHVFTWNGLDDTGRQLPSGIYLARLASNKQLGTCKLVLMK